MIIRNFVPPSKSNQITWYTVKYINLQISGISLKFHQVERSSFFLWPLYFPHLCDVIPRSTMPDRWYSLTTASHCLHQCCQYRSILEPIRWVLFDEFFIRFYYNPTPNTNCLLYNCHPIVNRINSGAYFKLFVYIWIPAIWLDPYQHVPVFYTWYHLIEQQIWKSIIST